jgi:hypothetical protein
MISAASGPTWSPPLVELRDPVYDVLDGVTLVSDRTKTRSAKCACFGVNRPTSSQERRIALL